jgi:hypothetical protein
MKKTTILILFILIGEFAYAQLLGQSKAYILKENELCKIEASFDNFLAFECNGYDEFYSFENGYCISLGIEVPEMVWLKMQVEIIKNGGKYLKSVAEAPLGTTAGTAPGSMYNDGRILYTFIEADTDGNGDSGTKLILMFLNKNLKE